MLYSQLLDFVDDKVNAGLGVVLLVLLGLDLTLFYLQHQLVMFVPFFEMI
jgi:hypothetical protein